MSPRFTKMVLLVLALALPGYAAAQKTTQLKVGGGGSPHVRTDWTIESANISVEYGRPSVRGRKIFGPGALLPYGQVWRTGADEATTLKTDKDLMFGSVAVPAGSYTLFTLPSDTTWKLIINKQTGQWGTDYDEKQDLARIDMKTEKLSQPVEQLTITIEPQSGGGVLAVAWADTRASAPFMVKR